LESIQVTGAANEALPPLKQPLVIAGMGGVAGSTAIFPISHQMVVCRGHLLADIIMATQTGIHAYRNTLAGMAVIAAGSIWLMQKVSNQSPVVAPVRAVAGSTAFHLGGITGMLLLNRLGRMTVQAKRVGLLDKQGGIGRLVCIMAGRAFPLCIGRMGKFELLGQTGVAGKAGF
jgi:hypothetical protein